MSLDRIETEPVAEIAARYRTAVEAGDAASLAALYQSDALLDAHVPNWRFQVRGVAEVAQQLCVLPRPGAFATFDAEATASGLLVQFAWRQRPADGGALVRQLHALRLHDGRIAEQRIFCAGVWGPGLQERMAAEAPLILP